MRSIMSLHRKEGVSISVRREDCPYLCQLDQALSKSSRREACRVVTRMSFGRTVRATGGRSRAFRCRYSAHMDSLQPTIVSTTLARCMVAQYGAVSRAGMGFRLETLSVSFDRRAVAVFRANWEVRSMRLESCDLREPFGVSAEKPHEEFGGSGISRVG